MTSSIRQHIIQALQFSRNILPAFPVTKFTPLFYFSPCFSLSSLFFFLLSILNEIRFCCFCTVRPMKNVAIFVNWRQNTNFETVGIQLKVESSNHIIAQTTYFLPLQRDYMNKLDILGAKVAFYYTFHFPQIGWCLWGKICGKAAGIYLLKVNNGSNSTMCEICSKLTIKTQERRELWKN